VFFSLSTPMCNKVKSMPANVGQKAEPKGATAVQTSSLLLFGNCGALSTHSVAEALLAAVQSLNLNSMVQCAFSSRHHLVSAF
jgi:hypothetical protein